MLRYAASIRVDLLAYCGIAAITVISPAFLGDDASFFNYVNNTVTPEPLYYYGGYVPFLTELTAYALRPLPAMWQAVLYRVVPLVALLVLYRETALFLGRAATFITARLWSLAIVLLLTALEPDLSANLSYAQWTVFCAATIVVLRARAGERPLSLPLIVFLIVAGIAFPVGAALAGLLLVLAFAGGDASGRTRWAATAVTIAVLQGWWLVGVPESLRNEDLLGSPRQFVALFQENTVANLVLVGALATLAACLGVTWRRRDPTLPVDRQDRFATVLALCYLTFCSVAVYVLSAQFVGNNYGFEPRYVVPALFSALVATALLAAGGGVRAAGVASFAALGFVALNAASDPRGPLALALMKYRFLSVAEAARAHCHEDDIWVFASENDSPILMCRPGTAAQIAERLKTFAPTVGARSPEDEEDGSLPSVIDPVPLLRQ